MDTGRYRVAQWATGHTGMSSLRSVIEHPRFDLVGVYVYSDAKVGRDAGELCGVEPTGITTTRDIEEILAARPDCVMYMPLLDHESIDDMCRLLASGANIVTTITTFHHPGSVDPVVRARIEKACEQGGTSLYDTGSCPGFITEVLPLALTLMERRLDRFTIDQFADLSTRRSPEFLGKFFGIYPDGADLKDGADRTASTDGASLRQIADAMSVPLDDLTATSKVAVAVNTVEIGVMTIRAGTVGAWRQRIVGYHQGKPLLEYSRTMYVTKDLEPAWDVLDTGWHITVRGDAPMDLDLRFATESYGWYSPGINANLPVNSVPAVCAAPPGILTTADLRLIPSFG
ncbi:2,4-diaminopentanoate dehydrogenase [Frankia sp. Hr75.2]|nr:2,4-diaminopentanoate dehydrogenase [Frankia sp. Hr75.2]